MNQHLERDLSGVYAIINIVTGYLYIGSALNLKRRKIRHYTELRCQHHHNERLQRAWNKYGEAAFSFKILFLCDSQNLLFYEQRCLDNLKLSGSGYNLCWIAGSILGIKRSPETRAKLSIKCRHPHSKEARERMSMAHTGIPLSETHRANMTAAIRAKLKGAPLSEEHREKLSIAATGRRHSPETLKVMSVCKQGKPWPLARRLAQERKYGARPAS